MSEKVKQAAKFLVDAIRIAHCMDFDVYLKMMCGDEVVEQENPRHAYMFGKWKKQQDDFGGWYCDLDEGNMARFAQYVIDRNEP